MKVKASSTRNSKAVAFLAHAHVHAPIPLLEVGILGSLPGSHAIVMVQLQDRGSGVGIKGVGNRCAIFGCQSQIDSCI